MKLPWKISKFNIKKRYVIVSVVLLLIVLPVGLYFYGPLGRLTYGLFSYLPYPVAIAEGNVITTRELISDTKALKIFYTSQDFSSAGMRVDFDTEEGKMRLRIKEKDVFDKLVEDEIIRELANARGIVIRKQDADREINRQINQMGNRQALEMNLKKLYGWDIDDFRDKVVINQLYIQKLTEDFFAKEKTNQPQYNKITKAKGELKKDGSNFNEVVVRYSEGESAKNGGELGWFTEEQLVPEVAQVVFSMKPDSVSDIIQSSLGFHIVMLEEVREKNENQTNNDIVLEGQTPQSKEVKIKQIFIQGGGFLDWIKQEKKKASVTVLMKDYTWDQQAGRVTFRNEALNKLEETLRVKSQGDPSMQ